MKIQNGWMFFTTDAGSPCRVRLRDVSVYQADDSCGRTFVWSPRLHEVPGDHVAALDDYFAQSADT